MIRLTISLCMLMCSVGAASILQSRPPNPDRLDCATDTDLSVNIEAELHELEKGRSIPLNIAGTCEVMVAGRPDVLPLDATRVDASIVAPGNEQPVSTGTVIEDSWGRERSESKPAAQLDAGAGQFRLSIKLAHSRWPAPKIPKSSARDKYTFAVDIRGRVYDNRLKPLRTWLEESRLNKYFSVVEACDVKGSASDCAWARRQAVRVGYYRNGRFAEAFGIDDSEEIAIPGDNAALRAANMPLVVVELRPLLERFKLESFLRAFEKNNGTSLWDKALAKAASGYGISTQDFAIIANVPCHSRIIYRLPNGRTEDDGFVCMSASASAFLGAYNKAVVSQSAATTIKPVSLPKLVNLILNREFVPVGGRWTALETNDDYVEGIVRGIKGVVVRGSRSWERLHLSFFLTKSAHGATLRIVADANAAPGLGSYPPDSQFTEDIEIRNGRAISNYVRCLANLSKSLAAGVNSGICHQ